MSGVCLTHQGGHSSKIEQLIQHPAELRGMFGTTVSLSTDLMQYKSATQQKHHLSAIAG